MEFGSRILRQTRLDLQVYKCKLSAVVVKIDTTTATAFPHFRSQSQHAMDERNLFNKCDGIYSFGIWVLGNRLDGWSTFDTVEDYSASH